MKTDLGKLLDDMVDGFKPSPTPQDEINAKVNELENKLTDMIESKLSNINISQNTPKPTEPTHDDTQGDGNEPDDTQGDGNEPDNN